MQIRLKCALTVVIFLLIFPDIHAESVPEISPKRSVLNDSGVRMAFAPWGLSADWVNYKLNNGSTNKGIAPALSMSYLQPWEIGEGQPGTFDGGGYIKFTVGFGKIKNSASGGKKNWIPYDFSLGPYGSYVSKNGHHEFGADYGMIGIYGYSEFAYFGSQFSAKYRYRILQAEFTRGGTGIFTGCIVPKFQSAATHSAGLYAVLPSGLIAGMRYTKVPSGGAKDGFTVEEWRVFFGMNLSGIN